MKGQKGEIPRALRTGPQPNYVFPRMGILKYTNRISELRQMGYDIRCDENHGESMRYYTLHESNGELPMGGSP